MKRCHLETMNQHGWPRDGYIPTLFVSKLDKALSNLGGEKPGQVTAMKWSELHNYLLR